MYCIFFLTLLYKGFKLSYYFIMEAFLQNLSSDTLLGRIEGACALSKAGYPTSPATLSTKASRGGGPLYRKFGRRALYRWADLLEWAEGQMSPPLRNTSEADV